MNLFNLAAKISLNDDDYNSKMKQATDSGEKLGNSSKGVGNKLLTMGNIIKGVAVGAVGVFVKNSIMAASEVEEMSSKFTAVFGEMEGEADAWATSFSNSIGRNKNDIKGMIASQADLIMGFGETSDGAFDLSKKITSLAFDLGSFNNVADDEAVLKLQKSIMGLETSGALESLGVDLTETTMKTSEFTLATGKSWNELSRTEKMQVRYQEAMKQSERAVGDAERTAGGFANSTKALQSKMKELTQTIGTYFLPIATDVVNFLKDGVTYIIDFVEKIGEGMSLFKENMENGQGAIDSLKNVFSNVFGIELPDTFWTMVESIMGFFTVLWETMKEAWDTIAVPIIDGIKLAFEGLGNESGNIFDFIGKAFELMTEYIKVGWENIGKPVFDMIMSIVQIVAEYFAEKMPEIKEFFGGMVKDIQGFWENNLKPCFEAIGNFIKNVLAPAFENVFKYIILPIVDSVFHGIGNLWNNSLKPIFTGIIDFITGVFSGNWRKAWDGVVQAFGGVMSGLGTVIKAPLNAVIALINGAIKQLNKINITIPDFVPFFGGNSFGVNLPTISYLENGGILTEPTMLNSNVMAGEKNQGRSNQTEVVVPLDRLEQWIYALANRAVNVEVDGKEIARAAAPYQEEFDEYNSRNIAFA